MRPFAYPRRLRAIKDFLVLPKSCKSDVLDQRDIKPGLAEVIDTAIRMAGLVGSRFLGCIARGLATLDVGRPITFVRRPKSAKTADLGSEYEDVRSRIAEYARKKKYEQTPPRREPSHMREDDGVLQRPAA